MCSTGVLQCLLLLYLLFILMHAHGSEKYLHIDQNMWLGSVKPWNVAPVIFMNRHNQTQSAVCKLWMLFVLRNSYSNTYERTALSQQLAKRPSQIK